MKSQKVIVTLLVVIVLVFLQTSSALGEGGKNSFTPADQMGQSSAAPACDPDEMGKKIQSAASNLSDTICGTSEIVASDSLGAFSSKDKDFFAKQCERAKGWANAPGRDKTFSAQGKNDSSCYIVEIDNDAIGDNDGICTQNEKIKGGCVEASEGNGNHNGICEEVSQSAVDGKKVKTWETCEEICIVSEEQATADCEQLTAMEGLLTDSASNLSGLNAQVSSQLKILAEQQAESNALATTSDPEDLCANVLHVEINAPGVIGPYGSYTGDERVSSYGEALGWTIALETASGAANICTDIAGQTVAGFNTSAACVALHVAQSVVSGVLSSMSQMDDEITSSRIDNAAMCLTYMNTKLDALKSQASESNAKLLALQNQLTEIIRLLNTPQGRRDNFPTK